MRRHLLQYVFTQFSLQIYLKKYIMKYFTLHRSGLMDAPCISFHIQFIEKNKMTPGSNKQYLKFGPSGDPIKCKWRSIMIHDGNSENIKRLERKIDIYVFIKCSSFMASKTLAAYCNLLLKNVSCYCFELQLLKVKLSLTITHIET